MTAREAGADGGRRRGAPEDASPKASRARVTEAGGLQRRACALAVAVALLVGPAGAFLRLSDVPLAVRLLWPVAFVAMMASPRIAVLAFLALSPLLAIVPDLFGWAPVSLGEMWLLALVAGACLRAAFASDGAAARSAASASASASPSGSASAPASAFTPAPARDGLLPMAGLVLAVVATASLAVALYPYQLGREGLLPLAWDLWAFWRSDLIVVSSQRHLYASIVAWLTILEGLALLWLLRRTLRVAGDARRALCAMAVGGACVAAIGVYQWWSGSMLLVKWRIFDPYITRINATFSDVNSAGAYFAMLLAPAWALALTATDAWRRRAWMAAAALMAVGLIFTGSRSGWLAAIVAGIVFLVGDRIREGPADQPWHVRGRRPLLALAAALALLVGLSIYATARDVRHRDQRSYIDTALFTLNMRAPLDERLKGRLAFWQAAWHMLEEHPLDGVGIGRYYKLMPNYLADAGAPVVQENAHNYFLQLAAEIGLVGLAALLALYASALAAGWRAWRDDADASRRRLALGAAGGTIAFLTTGLTGHSLLLHEGQLTFMPLLALLFVMGRRAAAAHVPAARARGWPRRAGLAIAWLTMVAVCVSVPFRSSAAVRSINLVGQTVGLFGLERASDGTPFQWTAPRATLYLSPDLRVLRLPLRTVAPMPQTVDITLNERHIDRVILTDHAWHIVSYQLPPLRSGETFHRLDLAVAPPWVPSATDARELGVMLGDYSR